MSVLVSAVTNARCSSLIPTVRRRTARLLAGTVLVVMGSVPLLWLVGARPGRYALVLGIAVLLGSYLKYLALACFFEDTSPPIRWSDWVVFAALLLTDGLSYALFPGRRSLVKGSQAEFGQTRRVGRAVAYVSAVAVCVQWGFLILGALLLLAQGLMGQEQAMAQRATRLAPIPIVAAGIFSLLSLPLFLTRALREEDDLRWLWFVTLLVTPIVGSLLWVRTHPWQPASGGIARAGGVR